MLIVVENTYPEYEGVAHAKPGDIVQWEIGGRLQNLVRVIDGKTVFGRDRKPSTEEDNRPSVGVIAEVKSRGWRLKIEKN